MRRNALARIGELETAECDISHEMERPRCLYKERARLATQYKKIMSERRALKDWLHANRAALEYMDSDKGANLKKWLDGFIGAVRKAQ